MKTALVFGHSSGLGLAVTKRLIDRGWTVVGAARARVELPGVTNIEADFSDRRQLETLTERIKQEYAQFDLLIFATGMLTMHDIERLDYEDMVYCYRVNVVSAMYIESQLLPLVKACEADIVNVTSISALAHHESYSEYSTSKAALVKFTSDLKAELDSTPCRVIDFCPSGFMSNIYRTMTGEKVERDERKQMKAEDLAELMVSLIELPKRIEVSKIILDRKS